MRWKDEFKKTDDFEFTFRKTVEHWYPQNPSEGEKWSEVDQFGNLCIMQRNINSKFSNLQPHSKKNEYSAKIAKGSLKLRLMSSLTGNTTSDDWVNIKCAEHGKEMIAKLQKEFQNLNLTQDRAQLTNE